MYIDQTDLDFWVVKFLLSLQFLSSKFFAFFVEDFEFSPSIYHWFNELSQLQDKDDWIFREIRLN